MPRKIQYLTAGLLLIIAWSVASFLAATADDVAKFIAGMRVFGKRAIQRPCACGRTVLERWQVPLQTMGTS